jgi:hypothetical protein
VVGQAALAHGEQERLRCERFESLLDALALALRAMNPSGAAAARGIVAARLAIPFSRRRCG